MAAGASAEALLGLTDYEARVYRVLLAEGPATRAKAPGSRSSAASTLISPS